MLQFNMSSLRGKRQPLHMLQWLCCSNLMTIPSNLVVVGWCQQVQCPLCAIMGGPNFSSVAVVLLSLCLMAGQGGGSNETHRAVITLGQITLGERAGSHPQETLKAHIKACTIYGSWNYMCYISSPKWFTGTQIWCLHMQVTQGNLFFLAIEAVLGAHTHSYTVLMIY